MPNVVIPVVPRTNSATGSTAIPTAGVMGVGELATNKFLGRAYVKKEDNTVVDVAPLKTVNGVSPNGSGDAVLSAATVGAVSTAAVGAAGGVAELDGAGKLPVSRLPASVVGGLNYQGTWNATTNSPALVSGAGTKGHFYKVSVAGSVTIDGNDAWYVGDMIAFNGTAWDKLDGVNGEVLRVNSKLPGVGGNVDLTAADVGAIPAAEKGAASGVGSLGPDGKAPASQVPIATPSAIGGVKIGAGLSVSGDGTLSASAEALQIASDTVLGGVKVGATLAIGGDGTLNVGADVLTVNTTITGGMY